MARWSKLAMLAIAMGALMAATQGAFARSAEIYTALFSSLGAGGYDVVAYFKQGKAVPGDSAISVSYKGATWHFANAEDKALFLKNPTAYAPQYGGYCAWAVSQNYTASGDPEVWRIVNGKLYLNYDREVQAKWNANVAADIAAADRNWPSVLDK
jgi:YHS domain-containing protein